jgi:hypothetical protein
MDACNVFHNENFDYILSLFLSVPIFLSKYKKGKAGAFKRGTLVL